MSQTPFVTVFAIYPNLTQLDFTGPHQVLSRLPGATTIVASRDGGEIEAEGGLVIGRTRKLSEIERCDLICVPGGSAATETALDEEFVSQVRRLALGASYITSVCTGSLILGAAGLLQGKRAACHWAWRGLLTEFGAIPDPARVVRDGNIFTGGGVTAGIDFAFTMLAEIAGEGVCQGAHTRARVCACAALWMRAAGTRRWRHAEAGLRQHGQGDGAADCRSEEGWGAAAQLAVNCVAHPSTSQD